LTHKPNLLGYLGDILLVDARGIRPEDSRPIMEA
jgi:hypothetical protein